jgi:protoheme IX farnesyltransferase
MVVASSVLAYFIAAGSSFSWSVFVLLFIGGFGITAAANGINQVLEREFDSLMERTKIRPLAANRMKSSEAVLISGFMLVIGIMCLSFINPVVSFLGMLSFMLYAFVYTPLKRYSTISVAIGAIPGAFPVLIGVVAHDGTLTLLGLTLFMIQFLWQFPHFWAISFLSFDDYNNAGFKLLPKGKDGNIDRNLGAYSAVYSLLIIPTVLIAYYAGLETSMLALGGVILLTLIYTWYAIKMQIDNDRASALKLMFSSFFYLPLVLLLYIIG